MPITNQANETAIRYYQPAPILVKQNPSGTDYYFDVQSAVSLAWVKPEDVDSILARRGGCCNNRRQLFAYANDEAVRVWKGEAR